MILSWKLRTRDSGVTANARPYKVLSTDYADFTDSSPFNTKFVYFPCDQMLKKSIDGELHCRGVLQYAPTKDNNVRRYGRMCKEILAMFGVLWLSLVTAQDTIQVGTLTLGPCEEVEAYCGFLERSLDPTDTLSSETIEIAFEFYPQTDDSLENLGTIVATEGGPGYATTGSRDSYLELFDPLLEQRNFLLMDNRGTGGSGALECDLQYETVLTQDLIAACAEGLGDTAYLYGSALAADDLAALLDALELDTIDLYGDSYGTFFSQTFAGRHPDRLRSLVLDAAYPVVNFSPWYPENADAMRYAFETVCERSKTCEGSSLERLAQLAESLRVSTFTGTAPDSDGNEVEVEVNISSLGYLMALATYTPNIYRELDAAARAVLEKEDTAPLLRMVAENLPFVEEDITAYSAALFMAVSCSDYTQIYDTASLLEERPKQREASIAEQRTLNAEIYSPLTIDEYLSLALDYSVVDLCLSWAVAPEAYPPARPVSPDATFTDAPVLVLSGELDTITSPLSGQQTAEFFPNSHYVQVANSLHVTAIGDADNCASSIVRYFVENLEPGDTSCTSNIVEIRTVPEFVKSAKELQAAKALEDNEATREDLQVVTAAALGVGDVLTRWWVNYDGDGVGLRGGTFNYIYDDSDETLYRFELRGLRWTEDVSVTGVVDWNTDNGEISARLLVREEGTEPGILTLTWSDREPEADATITGFMGGRSVHATMPAP
jgi:pimeloyl-ACP methyl ester carboxylesterase